jgi:hypothetical protein
MNLDQIEHQFEKKTGEEAQIILGLVRHVRRMAADHLSAEGQLHERIRELETGRDRYRSMLVELKVLS